MLPTDADLQAEPEKTDHLALPFFAALGAHFALALNMPIEGVTADDQNWAMLREKSAALLRSHAGVGDEEWEEDARHYELARDVALMAWSVVAAWMSTSYLTHTVFREKHGSDRAGYEAAGVRWLQRHANAALLDFAIAAAVAVHVATDEDDHFPIISRNARRIRVEVATRLRREGLTRWPAILRAVDAEWTGDALARLMAAHAEAGHQQIDDVITRVEQIREATETAARNAADEARREVLASLASAGPTIPLANHQAAIRSYEERDRELTAKLSAAQRERDAMAERDSKLRSRIDALKERLGAAEDRVTELEDQLARVAAATQPGPAEHAGATPGAIEPDPRAFAGRPVLLYTGEANGEARALLARSFEPWGAASVTCYWADKDRGPDIVPRDAIVVVDVRFMSHSTSEAILRTAERSGAWSCVTTRAAALLAAEVAGFRKTMPDDTVPV